MEIGLGYTRIFLSVFFWDLIYLAPILLFLLTMITTLGLAIGKIEGWKLGESLYHAFINATTVGYGDVRPEQSASRFLSVVNAFVGLLVAGVFVGIGVHAVETAVTTIN